MRLRKGWEVTNQNGTITIHNLSNDSSVVKRAIRQGWTKKRVFILR